MTVALAAIAGLLAAAGITDILARPRRRSPRRPVVRRLARVGSRIGGPAPPADLSARLGAAGVELTVTEAMAVKAGAAAAGLAAVTPLAAAAPARLAAALMLAAPAAGFLALDVLLARRARQRARLIEAELADVLDLLRVAVQAGLGVMRALGEVGARHAGVLPAELRATAERVALGVPRAEALALLAVRAPLPGVLALVAALERSDRHGAPPAPALAALALDARAERTRRLREDAARAAPKIQLVIALLLVPAVMLMLTAALVGAVV